MKIKFAVITLAFISGLAWMDSMSAQGTAFTYQGRLNTTNGPANGSYDMSFALFDAANAGSQLGSTVTTNAVAVTNGLFMVTLDFGANFPGADRWLEIGVRTNGAASFVTLSPRQKLTPAPYAITAGNVVMNGLAAGTYGSAVTFNNAANSFSGSFAGDGSGLTGVNAAALGGVPASGFWQVTGDAGTTAGVDFLGTTDNQPLELKAYGERGLQLEYISRSSSYPLLFFQSGVNLLGGYWGNIISNNVIGGTIAGGGEQAGFLTTIPFPNIVNNDFGAIGGGYGNIAGTSSAIPGGYFNVATGNGSFAAGRLAQTTNSGSFIWNDGTATNFSSGPNHFDVFSSGGISFWTANALDVRDPAAYDGTIHVGAYAVGGDPKLVKFGDGDYVHVGENGADDRMELKAGNFFFTHDGIENGFVGINTASPQQQLEVNGKFMEVDGLGGEDAYLGGDGAGNDVQIGSLRSGVTAVAAYNAADNAYMHFYCSSITIEGGADLAEPFNISNPNKTIPDGAVVVIDDQHPGQLKISDRPYDTRVAGVVSGANGVNPGIQLKQHGVLEGGKNVALTGRVYVLADASNGAIHPGDMLTTSSQPGYAMKVTDHTRAQGAILGKAMTGLSEGQGMVLVLVTLQ